MVLKQTTIDQNQYSLDQTIHETIPVPHNDGKPKKVTNHYTVVYPPHERRKDSALYHRTHNDLCLKKRLPCFICGKQGAPGQPMETHHFYVEKVAQSGIDWPQFAEFAKRTYNIQTGLCLADNITDWSMVEQCPDIFVDSPQNMIVLCKEHHISGHKGIHHVPFPDWILQKWAANGHQFLI